jgi:hypothetical protein
MVMVMGPSIPIWMGEDVDVWWVDWDVVVGISDLHQEGFVQNTPVAHGFPLL